MYLRRDMGHDHAGRGAGDARHVVMLGQPVAMVASRSAAQTRSRPWAGLGGGVHLNDGGGVGEQGGASCQQLVQLCAKVNHSPMDETSTQFARTVVLLALVHPCSCAAGGAAV